MAVTTYINAIVVPYFSCDFSCYAVPFVNVVLLAISLCCNIQTAFGSIRVTERLAPPTSDHGVAGSNPVEGEILRESKRRFIAQGLSCSPFHRPLGLHEH